jgi:hypothetical protein
MPGRSGLVLSGAAQAGLAARAAPQYPLDRGSFAEGFARAEAGRQETCLGRVVLVPRRCQPPSAAGAEARPAGR